MGKLVLIQEHSRFNVHEITENAIVLVVTSAYALVDITTISWIECTKNDCELSFWTRSRYTVPTSIRKNINGTIMTLRLLSQII